MTEFNELEKKKSQFLSCIKNRLERRYVHATYTEHTHQIRGSYSLCSPNLPPAITQQDTKSIVILSLLTRGSMMLIQHRTD